MQVKFLAKEALQGLRGNLLRSLLTMFGIVIGIISVTVMLALGEGMSQNIQTSIGSFSQGDLTIQGDITDGDFEWIRDQQYVEAAAAFASVSAAVTVSGEEFSPEIQVAVGDYKEIQNYELTAGKDFDYQDFGYNEREAIVSDGFVEAVQEETGYNVGLGDRLLIGNAAYTVSGIATSDSQTFTRGDGLIILPYASAVGVLTGTPNFSSVAVNLKESTYYEVAGNDLLKGLNASRRLAADSEDVFTLQTAQSFIETMQSTISTITTFLAVVGGIALFVGGVGTMNMMLTTVTERTKEIGLRKAIGARERDIMMQILVESVLLTTLGGLIGILLTLIGGTIANRIFADSDIINIVVNGEVMLFATLVSIVVGIVFGLYPARRASRLQPVDALRAE